jgi:hypothetical protein
MKLLGAVGATCLFFLLGSTGPLGAQQQEEKRDKPQRPEQGKAPSQEHQAQPERRQEPAKKTQSKAQQPEKSAQQQQTPPKSEHQARKQPQQPQRSQADKTTRPEQQQQARGHQEQQNQQDHQRQTASSQRPQRTPQAEARQRAQPALRLSERGDGRISDQRFRSNFGREHAFHVGSPVLVGGYSRFRYGGYSFGFVEPWPVDWYYTDDVYIDYVDDGYYMYNPYYPCARFALTVVM